MIGGRIFFRDDLDGGEVAGETGAREFIGLLCFIAFRHQDEPVARGELGKSRFNAGQKLDLLLGDGLRESENSLAFFFRYRRWAEAFETINQRSRETGETVAVREDGFTFDRVQ